jgi:hypothetical protein
MVKSWSDMTPQVTLKGLRTTVCWHTPPIFLKGFKGGGFEQRFDQAASARLRPEFTTYEIGYKAELFDRGPLNFGPFHDEVQEPSSSADARVCRKYHQQCREVTIKGVESDLHPPCPDPEHSRLGQRHVS